MLYLSDEWISATATALASANPIPVDLTIGYIISGGPQGNREHSIVYGLRQPTCLAGLAEPSVSFLCEWVIAVSIAKGNKSPQRAFLDGDLKIHGDANSLIGQQQAMAEFDQHLDEVRSKTRYG